VVGGLLSIPIITFFAFIVRTQSVWYSLSAGKEVIGSTYPEELISEASCLVNPISCHESIGQ
jgi:hypothetical protein